MADSANNYTLPQASTSLGGIKADAKGVGDTVEGKIDAGTGKIYVPTYPTDTGDVNLIEVVQIDTTPLSITSKTVK